MKGLPMLFFGGADSHTFMHYDIDLANIFHFHFEGEKEVILFSQSENKFLYKVPHSLITHERIDFSVPDYNLWPALRHASGYKGTLRHGEALYMPEGYWHYMRYRTPGFSMSLRGIARNPRNLGKAIYNLLVMRNYDNAMRRLKGQKWIDWKNKEAILRTHKVSDASKD
jgi:predicted cupin superfamily sugar epimerase